jgi:transcriptional regulator with PAS, ATPase and Fis domain
MVQYVYLMFDGGGYPFPSHYRDAIEHDPTLSRLWHEDIYEYGTNLTVEDKLDEKAAHHHVIYIRCEYAGVGMEFLSKQEEKNSSWGDAFIGHYRKYAPHLLSHIHYVFLYIEQEQGEQPDEGPIASPYPKRTKDFEVVRIPFTEIYKSTDLHILRLVAAVKRQVAMIRAEEDAAFKIDLSHHILGESDAIKAVHRLIGKVAKVDSTVLILGETGTGKELIAHAIHKQSPRSSKKFVPVNCSAIPPGIAESELFGHARGSYTGAGTDRKGHFEMANGGTIFLDEIGDLPLTIQAKLLRTIQERTVVRVGSSEERRIDVRIIAATHRNLRQMVKAEAFRRDLFHRLDVARIVLPSLRERKDDIYAIAQGFLMEVNKKYGKECSFAADALELLREARWEGNVRELLNVVERSVVESEEDVMTAGYVRSCMDPEDTEETVVKIPPIGTPISLKEMERLHVMLVYEGSGRNQRKAAKILGIDEKTLRGRLKDSGIKE